MKPAVGRVVHVFADPAVNNGCDHAPAVITRVWNDELVSLRVTWNAEPGTAPREWLQSVPLHPDRDTAELAHLERWAHIPEDTRPRPSHAAWWPPRI